MKTNSSPLIAALTLSAIVLVAILLSTPGRHADAAMLVNQYDLSLMTAGTVGSDEAIVIVDKAAEKMLVYTLNNNKFSLMNGYVFGKDTH